MRGSDLDKLCTGHLYSLCASVQVNGELSENFGVGVGIRQGCVMSPLLFNVYLNSCMREMRARVGELVPRLKVRGTEEPLVAGLFADDTVLLAENVGTLQRTVDEIDRVCKGRKLKVNAEKSKVMVFRSQESRPLILQSHR